MKVIRTRYIDTAVRTLDQDGRRQVSAWFARLGNWETDEQIRGMTKPAKVSGMYDLTTDDDFRIFFTLDAAKGEIVLEDIARPSWYERPLAATPG